MPAFGLPFDSVSTGVPRSLKIFQFKFQNFKKFSFQIEAANAFSSHHIPHLINLMHFAVAAADQCKQGNMLVRLATLCTLHTLLPCSPCASFSCLATFLSLSFFSLFCSINCNSCHLCVHSFVAHAHTHTRAHALHILYLAYMAYE